MLVIAARSLAGCALAWIPDAAVERLQLRRPWPALGLDRPGRVLDAARKRCDKRACCACCCLGNIPDKLPPACFQLKLD